jgi:hypothetical protein
MMNAISSPLLPLGRRDAQERKPINHGSPKYQKSAQMSPKFAKVRPDCVTSQTTPVADTWDDKAPEKREASTSVMLRVTFLRS